MVQARDDGGGCSCSVAKLCPTLCDPMENLNELFGQPNINRGFLGSSAVKNNNVNNNSKEYVCSAGDLQETRVRSLGWEIPLE